MESKRKVKYAIKRKFPVIDIDATLEQAIKLMAASNVSVLAVKMQEKLIGIVTVTDVMHGLAKKYDPKEIKISTFMTKCEFSTKDSTKHSCIQLDEDEDVLSAIKLMLEAGINHVLVTGEKHEPLGIVSSLELVKLTASL
jgi:predicted transcriptional regulator